MHLRNAVKALAISLPALATSAKTSRSTLQVLNYNNLGSSNNGTAAVLVHDELSSSKAQDQCSAIGETLYPFSSAPAANQTELQYQFDYLTFNHNLPCDTSIWVAPVDGKCMAYSYELKRAVPVPCDTNLPALCTSSVPPTIEGHRTPVESSKLPLTLRDFKMTGYRDARSFRFIGIPFANPPVGDLRFEPPQPYSGSNDIDATVFSDSCVQSVSGFGVEGGGISENCLYLNVYTPVLPAQGDLCSPRRAVAVYFYGGAFKEGSASMIDYDGGNFASRNDVVVVTVNYRLGALGFLSTGNLTTGSYGIQDQIMALKWVNKYIFAFGGDPSRVTIFGQSAGAQSVVALLSSSAANGLFSGAISQSAPLDLPWSTRKTYADLITPEVAKAVGCGDSLTPERALLSCLRSVPAKNYIISSPASKKLLSESAEEVGSDYLHDSALLAAIEPFMPVVDDSNSGVIDGQFYSLLANKSLPNSVPTMFTSVTNEAYLYVDGEVPPLGSSQSTLDMAFKIAYPPKLAAALARADVFPVDNSSTDGTRNALANALTCSEWTCPQAYLLDHAADSLPALFEAQIGQGHIQAIDGVPAICLPNPNFNASCHTSDVLLVWGTLNSKTIDVDPYYGERDLLHSQMLNDIFGSFFRSQNPNPDPKWLHVRGPAYAASYSVFGTDAYSIGKYVAGQKELSLLDMPPRTTVNPGVTGQCKVFTDFGYTFQRAALTV